MTTAALEGGQVGPPLVGVLRALMFGQVTGTVALATVEHTTLPAGLAASSVGLSRRNPAQAIPWAAHVDSPSVAHLAAAAALAGNPVTGFALGRAATSITSPAGPSASDAGNQGTPAATLHIDHLISQVTKNSK